MRPRYSEMRDAGGTAQLTEARTATPRKVDAASGVIHIPAADVGGSVDADVLAHADDGIAGLLDAIDRVTLIGDADRNKRSLVLGYRYHPRVVPRSKGPLRRVMPISAKIIGPVAVDRQPPYHLGRTDLARIGAEQDHVVNR